MADGGGGDGGGHGGGGDGGHAHGGAGHTYADQGGGIFKNIFGDTIGADGGSGGRRVKRSSSQSSSSQESSKGGGLISSIVSGIDSVISGTVRTVQNEFREPPKLKTGEKSAKPGAGMFMAVFVLSPAVAAVWYLSAALSDTYKNTFAGKAAASRNSGAAPGRT